MLPTLRQTPQQPRNAAETQPETRGQHGQRIDHEDGDHRQRQRIDRPPAATRQACHRNDGDHQYRAHGRQRESRQCRVQHRAGEGRQHRRLRARHAATQRRPAPPQRAHQQCEESGDQTDMESGNRNEMGQSGRAQLRPVVVVQRPRIAQRERAYETRGRLRHRIGDPRGHRFAPRIDPARPARFMRELRIAHITCRRDPFDHRMLFAIDAAGIAQPARRTQLRRQRPSAAGSDAQTRRIHRLVVRIEIVVPRQPHPPPAQGLRLGCDVIHLQHEPGPSRFMLRQFNDRAGQLRLPMLHRQRQLTFQGERSMRAGKNETQREDREMPPSASHARSDRCDRCSHSQKSCAGRRGKPKTDHHAEQKGQRKAKIEHGGLSDRAG